MSKFPPTAEQVEAVTNFGTGKRMKINAYAGTGKTSTMTLLAESTSRHGLYVGFNKSIVDEAKRKFPGNVECKTGHGLAFGQTVKQFGVPKMTGNINGGFIALKMGLKPQVVEDGGKIVLHLSARNWGFLMSETVKRWMRSGRDRIQSRDVPRDGKLGKLDEKLQSQVAAQVVEDANRLWAKMTNPKDDMPLSHDGYLKVWALRKPQIDADFILLDEAQDTNEVMLELMRGQTHAQLCCVGDRYQTIYAWRGAQNAMVLLPAELESRLSTSWRFGQGVADYATRVLRIMGETIPVNGNPAMESTLGPVDRPDMILCRTNSRVLDTVFGMVEAGKRPHIVGGTDDVMAFVNGAEKLMAGQSVERPAELFGFTSWDDVKMTAEMDQDPDLQRWVKLIDQYGVAKLRSVLQGLPKTKAEAEVSICTGHKSKGLEFGNIRLEDDFLLGIRAKDSGPTAGKLYPSEAYEAELCLHYVAVTRAQKRLQIAPKLQDIITKLEAGAAEMAAERARIAAAKAAA